MVAHDSIGRVLVLKAIFHEMIPSVFAAEALAYYQAVQFGLDNG